MTACLSLKRRHRGQGMVEFALAVPIFVVLLLGVIEFGRLFITFTSVYAAAREGARYGAAADNLCQGGVESTSQKVAPVAGGLVVTTSYDKGVGTSSFNDCNKAGLGDRVIVSASMPFSFITGIIPSPSGGFTIRSIAKRTIVKSAYLTWTIAPPSP